MDLRNFKKVSDKGHQAKFRHPDGHEIVVDKRKLHPEMQKQLQSLPLHMDDGGEVPDYIKNTLANSDQEPAFGSYGRLDDQKTNLPDFSKDHAAQEQALSDNRDAMKFHKTGGYQPEAAPQPQPMPMQSMGPQLANSQGGQAGGPQLANDMPMQVPQSQPDFFGANAYQDYMESGLGNQALGIQGEAQTQGQLGRAQAALARDDIRQQQMLQQRYQQNYDAIDKEIMGVIGDMKAGHINANHFWDTRSGWQKASILVGLALGGNPDIIHKAIDRDVNAQMQDMQTKNNILGAQFKRMGNMRDAVDMSRMIQATMYMDKMKEAAGRLQDPMARFQAMEKIGQMYQQFAPLASQMAMRRALLGGGQGGAQAQGIQAADMVGALPEHQQKDAYKELGEAQGLMKARDSALEAFDKASRLAHMKNYVGSPMQTKKQIAALIEPIIAEVSKTTAGRFTEQDAEMLRKLIEPSVWSNDQTRGVQRAQINDMFMKKANFPLLQRYRIDINQLNPRAQLDVGKRVR